MTASSFSKETCLSIALSIFFLFMPSLSVYLDVFLPKPSSLPISSVAILNNCSYSDLSLWFAQIDILQNMITDSINIRLPKDMYVIYFGSLCAILCINQRSCLASFASRSKIFISVAGVHNTAKTPITIHNNHNSPA